MGKVSNFGKKLQFEVSHVFVKMARFQILAKFRRSLSNDKVSNLAKNCNSS